MPGGSVKKQSGGIDLAQKNSSNNSGRSISNSSGSSRARKRKRCEIRRFSGSDLESELEDCNFEDAIALEKKLRKVAKDNDLNDEEMRRLLQKFVKNEHILALVTLQAEDEVAREREETEQPAIIITDTPSVPKLTRAKARELNKTPGITLSTSHESKEPEISALIQDELHSDEDDEEYVFKEEDFVSDDDPNTTASDLDSNPRTPQTPLSQAEAEDSPVKLTADGCFKIPLEKPKDTREDVRIAARTRSKLCLEQKAIEDIESEFVPPDVEQIDLKDLDMTGNDEDWMQFLNDFTKPLNSSFITDDDDPINDPEYVAADKIPEDAEELRDIDIPRKELTELVAELFEGLMNEGVSLESVELDTPQKFLQTNLQEPTITDGKDRSADVDKLPPATVGNAECEERSQATRQLNFDMPIQQVDYNPLQLQQGYPSDVPPLDTLSNVVNVTQNDCTFHPEVMSTPCPANRIDNRSTQLQVPVAYKDTPNEGASHVVTLPLSNLNLNPEWIAVKIPGQNNSYQLARVVPSANMLEPPPLVKIQPQIAPEPLQQQPPTPPPPADTRYSVPYDTNFTVEYISIRKHVYTEYISKFENLRNLPSKPTQVEELPSNAVGFTKFQHNILQQQLRIHVQMLTQTFIQSYSHPNYWKLAPKARGMLEEMEQKALDDASFRAWNLKPALKLIRQWEEELNKDTLENKEMMEFIHTEIDHTKSNCRQIPRFPPRIMDLILNSKVFMYPQYLPRIPFTTSHCSYEVFSPAEMQLIAMGLEKHIRRIRETGERVSKKTTELKTAVLRLAKDTVFGKSARRIWSRVKALRNTDYYNPVKYYFDHKRAPPVEHKLITFENNKVLPPKNRYEELPLAWQTHLDEKRTKNRKKGVKPSAAAGASYLQFVREALGEDIELPGSAAPAATPDDKVANPSLFAPKETNILYKKRSKRNFANSVTINVNYHFSGVISPNTTSTPALPATSPTNKNTLNTTELGCTALASTPPAANSTSISFNYDWNTKTLEPIIEPKRNATFENPANLQIIPKQREIKDVRLRRKLRFPGLSSRSQLSTYRYCSRRRKTSTYTHRRRSRRHLQKRCINLLSTYSANLKQKELFYKRAPVVLQVYRYFKALELYTDLLDQLKMACRNAPTDGAGCGSTANEQAVANSAYNSLHHSPTSKQLVHCGYFGKRTRAQLAQQQALEDESSVCSRSKKASRQEENFKHMLLPDSAEDANRKDAIYAFNFYEKVEETFKASNRPEDCKKFNHILKTFDPRRDKVSDLYYKLEGLFLPEYPELAQVFLTFLLPSEAADIGKFFEHFMINNMTTFINKLNIYFNKQPAQIRKIYNCLTELAEDPEVTIKKVESKILPLLKGNQFLIDWFLQQFSEAQPPERIFSPPEQINLKEIEIRSNLYESLNDPPDAATPCCELQQQHQQQQNQAQNCQLRYINGRIFYGNKMTLPAKLSFMASNYQQDSINECDAEELADQPMPECVHGIREHGEKRLAAAVDKAAAADANSDDNEKSEEEEVSKALIIDTANEEDSSSSVETCDDAALRAHAMRLNPSYYSSTCFTSITSTPNANSYHAPHHPNAKKSMNFNDDGKVISPRKHSTPGATCVAAANPASLTPTQCLSPNTVAGFSSALTAPSADNAAGGIEGNANSQILTLQQLRDRRKSPTKKSRSPVGVTRARASGQMQPMVVVYEQNSAIACAKKLQSLIDESEIDNKDRLSIVACSKNASNASMELQNADGSIVMQALEQRSASPHTPPLLTVTKVEHADNSDDMEFIPENSEVAHTFSQTCFAALEQPQVVEDANRSNITAATTTIITLTPSVPDKATTSEPYTEDCKLDVVATLSASTTDTTVSTSNVTHTPRQTSIPWRREEDKLILIEMKLSAGIAQERLFECIRAKLPERSVNEIEERFHFLMDFLSKLQGK
ncbi:uncharacterized protein LOC128868456 [Anastrepha ludens]|uniref:uncharacterized protein LOC128868456 n=1 Tax=Anastrepha ludens TaxID=28586 RepID=UPI0023B0A3C3|nr:uncharacterized protein LOC128868456 [Anastrepha ludens]